ncbi:Uncharacterised protein [[Clostridium] sordellii]|uniref:GNAT family N-acetyltransferase n=1 Tax=Paraclostridium sordellii TaxID=1505 RepID=UPI0005DEA7DD|nr:GNAT family N-acetyltransferase [Paeniclostridium sordellii]CEQ01204.1 Uncharacterised protein [[Clostridium] sordellii] [Paeniclostridium sordellii]
MINEEIIKNWGVPESIKGKKIEFIFNSNDLNYSYENDELLKNFTCDGVGSKFCLSDRDNKTIILIMDFIILGMRFNREKYIRLDCLCIKDSKLRGKGIAKYYLEKLIEFGISNKISKFVLFPDPSNELFKNIDKTNILNLEDLKGFYIKTFTNLGFNWKYEDENNEESRLVFEKL